MDYQGYRDAVQAGIKAGLVIPPLSGSKPKDVYESVRRQELIKKGICPNHPKRALPLHENHAVCRDCFIKDRDRKAKKRTSR